MIPFTGNRLNRASDKRGDSAWLGAMRRSGKARILPLWRLQPFLLGAADSTAPELGFVEVAVAGKLGALDATEVFLGRDGETPLFARDVSAEENPLSGALGSLGHFREARAAAQVLAGDAPAILAQAKSLIDWHARHGYCANCGSPTQERDGGYRRECRNCGAEHFPRTDPVVIMLVTHGDHGLIARNRRFPAGRYSTLAGFVEQGETIEEAVRREVFEETKIAVGKVTYFASQPWPFPSQLMIGCYAEALSRDFEVDGSEIEHAVWLPRGEILALLNHPKDGDSISLPRREAIAHHLIRAWAEQT